MSARFYRITGVSPRSHAATGTLPGPWVHGLSNGPLSCCGALDIAEFVVPVRWIARHPKADAYRETGMFSSQHSACKLRQEFTLERLAKHFGLDGDDA